MEISNGFTLPSAITAAQDKGHQWGSLHTEQTQAREMHPGALQPMKEECSTGKPDPRPSRNKGAGAALNGRAQLCVWCAARMDHPPENNPGEPLLCREHLTEPEHSSSHPTGADGCTSIPLLVPRRALQRTAEETWLQNSPSFAAGEGCTPAVCYGCTASTEGHNETVSKTLLSKGRGGQGREAEAVVCL